MQCGDLRCVGPSPGPAPSPRSSASPPWSAVRRFCTRIVTSGAPIARRPRFAPPSDSAHAERRPIGSTSSRRILVPVIPQQRVFDVIVKADRPLDLSLRVSVSRSSLLDQDRKHGLRIAIESCAAGWKVHANPLRTCARGFRQGVAGPCTQQGKGRSAAAICSHPEPGRSAFARSIAGVGSAGDSGDGGAATDAELRAPEMVYQVDASHIYISDTETTVFASRSTAARSTRLPAMELHHPGDSGTAATPSMPGSSGRRVSHSTPARCTSPTRTTTAFAASPPAPSTRSPAPVLSGSSKTAARRLSCSHLHAPTGLSWDAGSNALLTTPNPTCTLSGKSRVA